MLKTEPCIQDIGIYQSVGMTEQENGITMGLVCPDETTIQLSNITLVEGHMPQAADELLVEKGYVNALNLNGGIGDAITVHYRNQESWQLETKDFRITGFIQTTAENDRGRVAYYAIVSQDFVQENSALSAGSVSAMVTVCDTAKYTNQELKELIWNAGLECGIPADNIQVNHLNIDSNHMSKETVLTVLLIGIVLIGICSLVVYNIFFISIMNDVTSFGQLRTIGATKKQIRQIISKEGNDLALCFIPPGCVLGGTLSFLIDRNSFRLLSDAVLVFLSGMTVFVCVKLAILKPVKTAMSVSPVEAFRYTNIKEIKKSGKHLTLFSLASMNLLRNRKKSILTFTSLALSGMMFAGISYLLFSLDPEQRARQSFPYEGAYIVELNRALITPTFSLTELQENNLLTEELKNNILSIEGVDKIVCRQEIGVMTGGTETVIRSMNAEDYRELKDKVMTGVLPDCNHTGENALIVNTGSPELEYLQKSYEAGDVVTFSQAGKNRQSSFTYVVSAVIFDRNSADSFILPADEIERMVSYIIRSRPCQFSLTAYWLLYSNQPLQNGPACIVKEIVS